MSLLERKNTRRGRVEQTIEEKLEFEDGTEKEYVVEVVIDNAVSVYEEELKTGSPPGLYYQLPANIDRSLSRERFGTEKARKSLYGRRLMVSPDYCLTAYSTPASPAVKEFTSAPSISALVHWEGFPVSDRVLLMLFLFCFMFYM